jgi:hypothetical protein
MKFKKIIVIFQKNILSVICEYVTGSLGLEVGG